MRDKKIYLLYPNCGYCVYYMIQYKVISKKYKKEAVFLGKVLQYSLIFFIASVLFDRVEEIELAVVDELDDELAEKRVLPSEP